ncbi:hypothetical protein NMG60_11016282 [Bertholletia excelsa]
MMGKKKVPKKTKELSVAIAESSSIGTETQQRQTPRKRGRPRKVVEKIESEEIKEEQALASEVAERESKKAKTSEEEEGRAEVKEEEPASSSVGEAKKEGGTERPRSRARRKSKPRKSS